MECEVCGNKIYGKTIRAIIDGVKLFVCSDCAQFSTSIWKKDAPKYGLTTKALDYSTKPSSPFKRKTPSKLPQALDLVEDFGQRIRVGRVKHNLSHEVLSRMIGTKISILRKLETGKMVPDQPLAKKLERFLKIKILHAPLETSNLEKDFVKKASELTLGDVVIIQKRGVEEERERS
jgi:putative transcription factor